MGFWENFSNVFKKGVSVVAKKTDEYTKIGKIKVDIIGIKREIDKQFTELGGKVFHLIAEENNTRVAANQDVKDIIDKVKELNIKLNEKKEELARVRTEYGTTSDDIQDADYTVSDDKEPQG